MSKNKVLQAVENLENGNLTDAKRIVKKISLEKLIACTSRSYTMSYALLLSNYLKGKIPFETFCNESQKIQKI